VQADEGALPAVLPHVHAQVVLLDETLPGTSQLWDYVPDLKLARHLR
jgi:hypothetical protein